MDNTGRYHYTSDHSTAYHNAISLITQVGVAASKNTSFLLLAGLSNSSFQYQNASDEKIQTTRKLQPLVGLQMSYQITPGFSLDIGDQYSFGSDASTPMDTNTVPLTNVAYLGITMGSNYWYCPDMMICPTNYEMW